MCASNVTQQRRRLSLAGSAGRGEEEAGEAWRGRERRREVPQAGDSYYDYLR